jgi:hypothetical protein
MIYNNDPDSDKIYLKYGIANEIISPQICSGKIKYKLCRLFIQN